MNPTVTLVPITIENWRPFARLSRTLTAEQQTWVAHNAYSILETVYEPETTRVRGVVAPAGPAGETVPVGLTQYAYAPEMTAWFVQRLMIGGAYQGRGFGRAALLAALDEIRRLPGARDQVYISFEPENAPARLLYESVGFTDTGLLDDGECVYVLDLPAIAPAG
jgi:diamine N-acetyltransferase